MLEAFEEVTVKSDETTGGGELSISSILTGNFVCKSYYGTFVIIAGSHGNGETFESP